MCIAVVNSLGKGAGSNGQESHDEREPHVSIVALVKRPFRFFRRAVVLNSNAISILLFLAAGAVSFIAWSVRTHNRLGSYDLELAGMRKELENLKATQKEELLAIKADIRCMLEKQESHNIQAAETRRDVGFIKQLLERHSWR